MDIKERFNSLSPRSKKGIIWSALGIIILLFVVTGYNNRSASQKARDTKNGKEVRLDQDLLEKTVVREQRRKIEELEGTVRNIQKELEKGAVQKIADEESQKKKVEELPKIPDPAELEHSKPPLPPPPAWSAADGNQPQGNQPRERRKVGKISVVRNDIKTEAKKKGRSVYLPPSFMEANLLTGFDAATSGTSKNNPEPLLLRIKTPAVLPNDVQAELSGCFVVAEAVGRLDKERADVRLTSLACLSNEGRAVIDSPIKGFVTDSDSKVGLSGRVVSRMGAAALRAIIAGLFEGAGDAFKASATTTSTSALGSTQTIDSSQVGKASLGTGLSKGSQTMSDFYLDLVKQTTPIIEVGAAKKITVIISEGKDIEIKEKNPQPDETFSEKTTEN